MRSNTIFYVLLIVVVAAILTGRALAYDGDVDYSAPYLTVDPETGKLVTVDPRQGTVTPHPTTKPDATDLSKQSTTPDQATENSSDSLQKIAALSGILVIVLGGAFLFRKLIWTKHRRVHL